MSIEGAPHVKRKGWLKNGNPVGDFTKAPRCGAKTRKGTPCKAPAMKNGRCRFHGGKSTGAKTKEGKQKAANANYKHGRYSQDYLNENKKFRELFNILKSSLE